MAHRARRCPEAGAFPAGSEAALEARERLVHGACVKIAICIPRHGDTKGDFTISLARMIAYTLSAPPPAEGPIRIEIFSLSSSDLPANRDWLLKRAVEWQADYALWLDSDHVFPPQSLLRLLSHRLPVVGCNQPRRTVPTGPVASRINDKGEREHVWTTEALARSGAVAQVAHVGLALCLMDMRILHSVKAHVEKGAGWDNWKPFDRRRIAGTSGRMGEDASFFETLREAGVKVYVDHPLSWLVGHIGEHVFTNEEAEAQKEAWLAQPS
jgi:hypothetical protein